ncbi:MAG TPA: acyl-CoA reductase [Polyangiaceae bacterium]|nr:acyl-CoA reductase [Polyangiaceae bacterium]
MALRECLETSPSDDEVRALVSSVAPARAAHVVLGASVFVAAHRAIALALSASSRVFVKPSRREPQMTRLLAEAAPELFAIVDEVHPEDGDVVFAYGADETLDAIVHRLPPSVRFEGHGTGLGVVALDASSMGDPELELAANAVVRDVVPFDQRGCLSPRLVLVEGSDIAARLFSARVAQALVEAEQRVPRGRLSAGETAERVRYRDTMQYAGELFGSSRTGWVGLDVTGGPLLVSPVGRNLHVVVTRDARERLASISSWVTAIGIQGPRRFADRVTTAAPFARTSALGFMQRPPFDGPVDKRRTRARRP